jgi:hypothetical protein
MASVLGAWAAQSPQDAANYVSGLSGSEQERGMKSVISSMVGADAPYAASWIQNFPEGDVREEASKTLMKRWARDDPSSAAAWLANMAAGPSREAAVKQFVESAADLQPQVAWGLATSLTDPQQQKDALEKAAQQWLRTDDRAARAAIQASGYPPDLIARLLKPKD